MKIGPVYLSKIKYLVFSGGGMKAFLSFIGALKALERVCTAERLDFWGKLKGTAGSSMGSFFAFFVCLGCRAEAIEKIFMEKNLGTLTKNVSLGRFYHEKGLNDGSVVQKWLEDALASYGLPPQITLQQFYEHTNRNFVVTTTHLNSDPVPKTLYLSHKTFPHLGVVEAVLMSSALPFFFVPRIMPLLRPEKKEYFVDGGLLCNFAFHAFCDPLFEAAPQKNGEHNDKEKEKEKDEQQQKKNPHHDKRAETLGFIIEMDNYSERNMESNIPYVRSILEAPMFEMEKKYLENIPDEVASNVFFVPVGEVDTIDFDMPAQKKQEIVQSIISDMHFKIKSRVEMGKYTTAMTKHMLKLYSFLFQQSPPTPPPSSNTAPPSSYFSSFASLMPQDFSDPLPSSSSSSLFHKQEEHNESEAATNDSMSNFPNSSSCPPPN